MNPADAPKEIYSCERCPKTFVRLDLLIRHSERHDKRQEQQLADLPPRKRAKSDLSNTQPPRPATNPSTVSLEERALAAAAFSSNNGLAPPPDEQFQAWQQAQHAQFGGSLKLEQLGLPEGEEDGGLGGIELGSPLNGLTGLTPFGHAFDSPTVNFKDLHQALPNGLTYSQPPVVGPVDIVPPPQPHSEPTFDLSTFAPSVTQPTSTSALFDQPIQPNHQVQFAETNIIGQDELNGITAPDSSLFDFFQAGTGGAVSSPGRWQIPCRRS